MLAKNTTRLLRHSPSYFHLPCVCNLEHEYCPTPATTVSGGMACVPTSYFATFPCCGSLRSELQDTVADLPAQLQSQSGQLESTSALESALLDQQREVDRLQSQVLEQQQANDGLQREATLAHIQLEESREAFRVRIQHCMLEVCPSLANAHAVKPAC